MKGIERRFIVLLYSICFYLFAYFYNMGPANCAVIGCSNSTKKLQQWKQSVCDEYHQENCPRLPAPYRLFCFPSENR